MEKRLFQAKKFFELDNSQWGLGLTFSILGRIYSFKDHELANSKENIRKSKQYYISALDNFNQIDHYRGIYMTAKDLHDLE